MASLTQWTAFEQAPGDGEGQRSKVCCSPWGRKELDTVERLNNNDTVQPPPLGERGSNP